MMATEIGSSESRGRNANGTPAQGRSVIGRVSRRAATAVVLAITVAAGASAAAQADVGGFNGGDGTQAGANCTTTLDWSCLSSSQLVTTLDPAGSSDLAFVGSGNVENNPDGWRIGPASSASIDPKDDIQGNWSYSFLDPSLTTNYVALAFYRSSGSGNANIDFELNQSGSMYVNSQGTSVVCRTDGDVLVSFDVHSSASVGAVNFYQWEWTNGTPCTAGASGQFTQLTLPSDVAEGAMNSGPITNYLATSSFGNGLAPSTFGEAAIDLGAVANAISPSGGCEFFNHMQLTTRSSTSIESSMEDFVDGGNVIARACETGGGGGGGSCTTNPHVSITSPADGSTDPANTVVLRGTSDQPEIEVVDGTQVVGNPTVGSGSWSLTLDDVPNGPHTYTALATNSSGCTATSTVHLTVNGPNPSGGDGGGGGGGGTGGTNGGSTGGNGSGSVGSSGVAGTSATALACTGNSLALLDVYPLGRTAHLLGVAPLGMAGKRVKIVAAWSHKVLATVKIKRDSSFTAVVKLPPARFRASSKGAYLARLGTTSSPALKLARRLYNTSIAPRGGKVTFRGTVVGPFARPVKRVIIRGSSNCRTIGSGIVLARVKPSRRGTFSVTFRLPKSLSHLSVLFLRTQTVVQKPGRTGATASRARRATVTVFGITRGVRI